MDLRWDTPIRNTKVQWFCGGDMPRYSAGTTFIFLHLEKQKGKKRKQPISQALHGKLTLGRKKPLAVSLHESSDSERKQSERERKKKNNNNNNKKPKKNPNKQKKKERKTEREKKKKNKRKKNA